MSTSRAIVTINTPEDRATVARWAQKTGWGTVVEFKKKTRSTEQNAKMHAMLSEVADQVVWYGKKLKVEDWKNMFSASLRKAQVVPGIDPGTVVPLGIHTSTMTIEEMSNMIELIYAFGADPEHPVTFREPQEDMTNEPNNTPSDAASPGTSDVDGTPLTDVSPSSDVPSEPAGDSPLSAPAGSDLFGKFNYGTGELRYLKEFLEKGSKEARKSEDVASKPAKLKFIEMMFLDYSDPEIIFTEDGKTALAGIRRGLDLAIEGSRDIDRIEAWATTEFLTEANGNG